MTAAARRRPVVQRDGAGRDHQPVAVVIENRSGRDADYTIEIPAGAPAHFARQPEPIAIAAGQAARTPVAIVAPVAAFQRGLCDIVLHVSDDKTFHQDLPAGC